MKKLINLLLALQCFADAGTVVTGTSGYVDAYTGNVQPFDTKNSMNGELKVFYDTELLENTRMGIFYGQFAKKQKLPMNHGTSMEFRKWNTFEKAAVLQEGVIPTGQKFGMTSKTAGIFQMGTYAALTDKITTRAYDPVVLGATQEMGASASETQETLSRDCLLINTNVMYCDNYDPETGAFVSKPTTPAGMRNDDSAVCYMTDKMVNKAVTKMKKDKVPKINGKYYAVIHPSVALDLRECKGWRDAHMYAAPEEIMNGEIGELHGVRFIENPDAPVFKGADLASDSRTLTVNKSGGYSGAITSIAFDGGTVAASALVGRELFINGVPVVVKTNTASAITFDSTDFGTLADDTVIYPGDGGGNGECSYATYFFGKDAYGEIDPEGGNLETIIKPKEEIGGPLEQFSTVGYKLEFGAVMLYTERLLRVMSMSSSSADDDTNYDPDFYPSAI